MLTAVARGFVVFSVLLTAVGTGTVAAAADDSDEELVLLYAGDELLLEAAENQVVHGETTLDAGIEVTVRIRSAHGADDVFLESRFTEVDEYGTFNVSFDLSDKQANTSFTISAYGGGLSSDDVDGRLEPCTDCTSSPTQMTLPPADEATVVPAVRVRQSNTARIPVTYGDASRVTLVIGGEDVGFTATVTVRDENDDGRAVIEFDTSEAGFSSSPTRSDDDVVDESQTQLSRVLDPGDYPLRLYLGSDTDGEPVDVGTLSVLETPVLTETPTTQTAEPTPKSETETPVRNQSTVLDSMSNLLGSVGALALGGALAVVGIGVLLGFFRS
ncbi:BGTF surface domain-containing protein [Haloprofundus salilacus]|uniref:BGTF surface domain-containing protein n=1 Tax=Haloprofundus salilacus TaxID=2876190 RepID=UPI001CCA0289|nr:BGTF surface domain-containing protein [Haloprofundus salilacus]